VTYCSRSPQDGFRCRSTHPTRFRLIGYALREVGNERDARAVAATAWFACQRLEALQRKWQDLFKATARAAA